MVLIITTWERGGPGASQNRPLLARGVRQRLRQHLRQPCANPAPAPCASRLAETRQQQGALICFSKTAA